MKVGSIVECISSCYPTDYQESLGAKSIFKGTLFTIREFVPFEDETLCLLEEVTNPVNPASGIELGYPKRAFVELMPPEENILSEILKYTRPREIISIPVL